MLTTDPIPFTPNGIKERLARLGDIYKRINGLPQDVEDPALLARKVTLYNVAQGVIGEMYAQAVYDYNVAYNTRKERQAFYEDAFFGTIKDKENYAETKITAARREEARAEAEMKRWEKAYNSTEQLANAIKHELGVVFDDYRQGGRNIG